MDLLGPRITGVRVWLVVDKLYTVVDGIILSLLLLYQFWPVRGFVRVGIFGGGGVIFWLGRLLWRGLGFGFRIWVGIPLFRAVASVRALVVGGVGYIGVRFVHGGSTEEVWGVWVVLFCLGCLLWRGLGIGFSIW